MLQSWSLSRFGFVGRFVKIDPDSEAFKHTRACPGEGDGFDRLSNITKLTTYIFLEAMRQNVLSEEEVQSIMSNLLKEFNWTSNFRTARDYLFDLEQERKAEKFA